MQLCCYSPFCCWAICTCSQAAKLTVVLFLSSNTTYILFKLKDWQEHTTTSTTTTKSYNVPAFLQLYPPPCARRPTPATNPPVPKHGSGPERERERQRRARMQACRHAGQACDLADRLDARLHPPTQYYIVQYTLIRSAESGFVCTVYVALS